MGYIINGICIGLLASGLTSKYGGDAMRSCDWWVIMLSLTVLVNTWGNK